MKLCEKCGAYNSDERMFCVDCSEKLGDALSVQEEERLDAGIDAKINKLYNAKDPLHVSTFDRVCGFVCVACLLALLVLIGFGCLGRRPWAELEMLFYGCVFCVVGAFDAFLPQITWGLEKIRLGVWVNNADDLAPSDTYFIFRRIGLLVCVGIGVVALLIGAYGLF